MWVPKASVVLACVLALSVPGIGHAQEPGTTAGASGTPGALSSGGRVVDSGESLVPPLPPDFQETRARDWLARGYDLARAANAASGFARATLWREAIAAYRKVVDLDPQADVGVHASLASLLHRQAGESTNGDEARRFHSLAVTELRKVVRLDPDNAWGWRTLGGILASLALDTRDQSVLQKLLDEADRALEKATALEPGSGTGWSNLGSLRMVQGQFAATPADRDRFLAGAEAALSRAVSLEPGSGTAWSNLGDLNFRQAELAKDEQRSLFLNASAEAYRTALTLDPGNAGWRERLAMCLWGLARLAPEGEAGSWWEEALETYRTAVDQGPEQTAVRWSELAFLHLEAAAHLEDHRVPPVLDEATVYFRRATSADPGYTRAWLGLGLLLHDRGVAAANGRRSAFLDDAETALRTARDLDPEDWRVWAALGALYRTQAESLEGEAREQKEGQAAQVLVKARSLR